MEDINSYKSDIIYSLSHADRYADIADITGACCGGKEGGAKEVDLPIRCENTKGEESCCANQNIYETLKSRHDWSESDGERSEEERVGGASEIEAHGAESEAPVGGATGGDLAPPPIPCHKVDNGPFAPEFLKKESDVFQAYSNNLYGYHK